jgi:hypothetical protein
MIERVRVQLTAWARWRGIVSKIATFLILGWLAYWLYENRALTREVFTELGALGLLASLAAMTVTLWLSSVAFAMLVRGMGYNDFSALDAYHCLNLSQIAAMLPGKVWGYAGLAGLLWARQISKRDSVAIIALNTGLMLSACALVALSGSSYALVALAPLIALLLTRDALENLRQRFFSDGSPLPARGVLFNFLIIAIVVWAISGAIFAWLAQSSAANVSPLALVSAYAAGYLAGYISLIAPAGLGVSEGVTSILLASSIGIERAFAVALTFRIIQTLAQWTNIFVSLILLNRVK